MRVLMDDPLLSVRNCFVMVYEGAIRAHRGEGGDVTELRKSIMHPRYAIGIVFALQV